MPKQMTPKLLQAYRDQAHVYESFRPNGRFHIICPQCRSPILLFDDLDTDFKREVTEVSRRSRLQAVQLLQLKTGCDLGLAKAAVFHICNAQSGCHKCGAAVPRGALLCSQCMAVNLDWQFNPLSD